MIHSMDALLSRYEGGISEKFGPFEKPTDHAFTAKEFEAYCISKGLSKTHARAVLKEHRDRGTLKMFTRKTRDARQRPIGVPSYAFADNGEGN